MSTFAKRARHASDSHAMLFYNTLRREEFASGWIVDAIRTRNIQFVALLEYLPRIPFTVLECIEGVVMTPYVRPECVRHIHAKFNLTKRLGVAEAEFVRMFHTQKEKRKSLVVDLVGNDVYAMDETNATI